MILSLLQAVDKICGNVCVKWLDRQVDTKSQHSCQLRSCQQIDQQTMQPLLNWNQTKEYWSY